MARVPLVDETTHPELAPLIERIKTERGGRLLNLYKVLLNSPDVAMGWLALFTAIRQKGKLGERFRELAIMRIAMLNGAKYEYDQHVPFALKAGLTQAQLDALPEWRKASVFGPADQAVLEYVDAMTRKIQVSDRVFKRVRRLFDDRELVELTATIGGYNLVSRFLEALAIEHE
jgi:alkylhydroperoxidase family enzyme